MGIQADIKTVTCLGSYAMTAITAITSQNTTGAKTEDGKIIKMDVKIGDRVLFGKWSGTEVKIDGKEYSIMKESDIMGVSKK